MSRAMNLKIKPETVVTHCAKAGVRISAIEQLPSGHTHLVCVTGEGADEMRRLLAKHVVEGRQARYAYMTARTPR